MRPTCILQQQQPQKILKQWLNVSTPTARNIVRNILRDKSPIDSHELFERTQQVQLDPEMVRQREEVYQQLLKRTDIKPPPNPLHPIRSLHYLKAVVMSDLVERHHAEKIFRKRDPTPEERALLSHTKPLTLKQRKRRGALGPGKRPPLCISGQINEWLWNITEEGLNAPAEREVSDSKFGLVYDEVRLRRKAFRRNNPTGVESKSKSNDHFFEPKTQNDQRRSE